MKILPVESSCCIYADRRTDGQMDRRTDMTNLTVAFRNFANAPRKDVTAHMSINRSRVLQYVSQLICL